MRSLPAPAPRAAASRRSRLAGGLLTLLLAGGLGCTTAQLTRTYEGEPIPRPDLILVYDFAYSPGQIKLDRGISAEVAEAMRGSSRTAQELEVGQKVAASVSEEIVKRLRALGLPAQRAEGPPGGTGNALGIEGQFLSIDEGNRTERVVIGLGAGRTDVQVLSQLYLDSQGGQRVLESADATSKSGRNPGMAETMGAGGLMGHLVVSAAVSGAAQIGSEAFGSNVEADGERVAKAVVEQFEPFFVEEGWIVPPS